MKEEYRLNYSLGYVVEYLDSGEERCTSWLLIPAENLWNTSLRGILYTLALAYLFLGIAIASDVFMCSIEVITSKKRKVIRWDEERQEKVEREVLLWNETVANLTLMALGSSAPEILLATVEMIGELEERNPRDALGTFTIIGSAAFNLLMITAVCVLSVPTGQVKTIKELGVFIVTSIWSIWAYIWMLLVVKYITPGQIDPWEAWVTLIFLPVFVFVSYMADRGWLCRFNKKKLSVGVEASPQADPHPVRLVERPHHTFTHPVSKELSLLESERAQRRRDKILEGRTSSKTSSTTKSHIFARARFRHAAVRSLMGSSSIGLLPEKISMSDLILRVQKINEAVSQGKSAQEIKRALMKSSSALMKMTPVGPDYKIPAMKGELLGFFSTVSDRFAVQQSAGVVEIAIVFNRYVQSVPILKKLIVRDKAAIKEQQPSASQKNSIEMDTLPGMVSVEFETRESSAKEGIHFTHTSGRLIFKENEYLKQIKVPILITDEFETDVDFYLLLKNPMGGAGLGEPSITRVTIVADNEPGEFLFEQPQYHADMRSGVVSVRVAREHGFHGTVTLEYSTIDGTAVGGKTLDGTADYLETQGVLTFEHGETSKDITVNFNKNVKESKNFIIAIRNPSSGSKVGIRSAVVVHLNTDALMERVVDVLEDEEEEITWSRQFMQAMSVSADSDEDGMEKPPQWNHYLMHFLTFFWKVFCAFIPPTSILGAWPSFLMSLVFIGFMTACVEQLGKLLGCVVGLKTSVTGITIIALGTSLPDTFASRTAAVQDENADAAIGNVTGSNCVNVFLGLGLPWVLKSVHASNHGYIFKVRTDNLSQSVIIFTACGTLCLFTLLIRRKVAGGELGGTFGAKYFMAGLYTFLWIAYVVAVSLHSYGVVLGGELGGKTFCGKLLTSGFLCFLWFIYITLCSLNAYNWISW